MKLCSVQQDNMTKLVEQLSIKIMQIDWSGAACKGKNGAACKGNSSAKRKVVQQHAKGKAVQHAKVPFERHTGLLADP